MNAKHKATIMFLLSKEIGKRYPNWSDEENKARCDHLWETLDAFDYMCNNQQMVKEK